MKKIYKKSQISQANLNLRGAMFAARQALEINDPTKLVEKTGYLSNALNEYKAVVTNYKLNPKSPELKKAEMLLRNIVQQLRSSIKVIK